jgi:hypothetical protein
VVQGWLFIGRHILTGMLIAVGDSASKHFSTYYRLLFSAASWSRPRKVSMSSTRVTRDWTGHCLDSQLTYESSDTSSESFAHAPAQFDMLGVARRQALGSENNERALSCTGSTRTGCGSGGTIPRRLDR